MSIHYVKGKPYFSDAEQKIKQYPYLNQNMDCEVLIIGGGINGAIANYYFSGENIDTILIEKNKIGYTSTACATALLEYQLDDHAELIILDSLMTIALLSVEKILLLKMT